MTSNSTGLLTVRLESKEAYAFALGRLAEESVWFAVTPLPDDEYDLTVKGEHLSTPLGQYLRSLSVKSGEFAPRFSEGPYQEPSPPAVEKEYDVWLYETWVSRYRVRAAGVGQAIVAARGLDAKEAKESIFHEANDEAGNTADELYAIFDEEEAEEAIKHLISECVVSEGAKGEEWIPGLYTISIVEEEEG